MASTHEFNEAVARAEKDAESLRLEVWGDRLPVDPVIIASRLGIKVIEAEIDPQVSGMIKKEAGSDPVIVLSRSDSPARQRFTCAHELGHFFKRQGDQEFAYVDLRVNERMGIKKPTEEVYADAFAASLLMPVSMMKQHASSKRPELWNLARQFGVSIEAMKIRRATLDLGK